MRMRKEKETYVLTGKKKDGTLYFPFERFNYKKEAIKFAEEKIKEDEIIKLNVWNNKTNQIIWAKYKD